MPWSSPDACVGIKPQVWLGKFSFLPTPAVSSANLAVSWSPIPVFVGKTGKWYLKLPSLPE